MSRPYIDTEPCTIEPEDVAVFLERHSRPRAADMVRSLSKASRDAWAQYHRLHSDYTLIYERLQQYEPTQSYTPPTGVPPPESSD